MHPGVEFLVGDPEPPVGKERQAPEVVAGEFLRAEQFAVRGRNHREAPAEGVGDQQFPVAQEQHLLRLEGEIGDPARSAQILGGRTSGRVRSYICTRRDQRQETASDEPWRAAWIG